MNKITKSEAREFVKHYLVAALWSSHDWRNEPDSPEYDPDNSGEFMDESFEWDDATRETLHKARRDVFDFIRQCDEQGIDLRSTCIPSSEYTAWMQHGHDLWLTRNGHGAGFWDRGYGPVGDDLSKIARHMGGCNPYAIDNRTWAME